MFCFRSYLKYIFGTSCENSVCNHAVNLIPTSLHIAATYRCCHFSLSKIFVLTRKMATETFPFISDLLTTNRPTNDVELADARRFSADYNRTLNTLRQKISEAEAYLERLTIEELMLLENHVLPLRHVVAPIHRVREDIVREIFAQCLDTDSNPTMSRKNAPTLLTRISSGW